METVLIKARSVASQHSTYYQSGLRFKNKISKNTSDKLTPLARWNIVDGRDSVVEDEDLQEALLKNPAAVWGQKGRKTGFGSDLGSPEPLLATTIVLSATARIIDEDRNRTGNSNHLLWACRRSPPGPLELPVQVIEMGLYSCMWNDSLSKIWEKSTFKASSSVATKIFAWSGLSYRVFEKWEQLKSINTLFFFLWSEFALFNKLQLLRVLTLICWSV